MPLFDVRNNLFKLHFGGLNLSRRKLMKFFAFKVLLGYFLDFEGFWINFESILVLQVLLDPHSENILIDRQLQFLVHDVNLLLFVLQHLSHLVHPLLVVLLYVLASRDFIDQFGLVLGALLLDCGEMTLEIAKKLRKLVFLGHCGLQLLRHCE